MSEALSFGARLRRAPTPVRLRVFLYGIWAGAALLFLAGEGSLSGARSAMKTIGHDAAPSIIAAQEISTALADLDAAAAAYVLGGAAQQPAARETIEQRRAGLAKRLVDAAANITYGDAEEVPIRTLLDGTGRYLEIFGEARFRSDSGDRLGAARRYGAATDLMHQQLLPAANALDEANRSHLDAEARRQERNSQGAELVAGAVGALLLALLVWAQWFLLHRMRRIVNVPLLGATVIGTLLTAYLVTRIGAARADLHVAEADAFASIHALWKARAIAYDARGDDTRASLDAGAQSFQERYRDKILRLTAVPPAEAAASARRDAAPGFAGLFGEELRNITFDGEREAAVRMVEELARYDALRSTAAFDRFDRALLDTLGINRRAFDTTIERGEGALSIATRVLPLAAAAIAVLALLGIRSRLREYTG